MLQVLEALAHVHARGVVHCDVKPENICLATKAPDSPIKLIDFGMASFTHTPMDPGGAALHPKSPTPYTLNPDQNPLCRTQIFGPKY